MMSSCVYGSSAAVLLDTLASEKHARGALLSAFLEDLRRAFDDSAPPSSRELLDRAETENLSDADCDVLIGELRSTLAK